MEQIRELIDDVLFLSELETGRAVVALSATRVLPELEQVAVELAESAARAGVRLRVDGDAGVELALRPRMLRVVAQNLAENAIRYSGPGSTFTLSVSRVEGGVVLRAADDGIGVVEADLPRLFERFYRADRARASRGTGLGLAIVKHVVTSAGGTVEARSARGHGLEITTLELFFDLVFVLALTQCTALMAADPTWHGLVRGVTRPRRPVVGVGRVCVVDERRRPGGGCRPARDLRGDGGVPRGSVERAERVR